MSAIKISTVGAQCKILSRNVVWLGYHYVPYYEFILYGEGKILISQLSMATIHIENLLLQKIHNSVCHKSRFRISYRTFPTHNLTSQKFPYKISYCKIPLTIKFSNKKFYCRELISRNFCNGDVCNGNVHPEYMCNCNVFKGIFCNSESAVHQLASIGP